MKRQRLGPPLRVAVWAALAALMLHGVVLSGLPGGGGLADVAVAPSAVHVRAIALPTDMQTASPVGSAELPPAPVSPSPVLPKRPSTPPPSADLAPEPAPTIPVTEAVAEAPSDTPHSPDAAASTPTSTAALAPQASAVPPPTAPASAVTSEPPATAAAGGVADSGEPIPIYPTSFAPSQNLRFQLQRGMLSGVGTLRWHHDDRNSAGARYELRLEAKVAGLSLLTQVSEGGFDAAGLAPERFTDQRLSRSAQAANFQRPRGVISFSGPAVEYPLIPGTQDRLSWMLQLPAILAAAPMRAAPGERITLYVVGARGDTAVWVFRFVGAENVATDAGDVPALKFIREPSKPNDTQAEVWLDPSRHHMPVRARIGNPPDGDVLEMVRLSPEA